MKSKWLIEQRIAVEENPVAVEALLWALESPECPLCNHVQRKDIEIQIYNGNMTSSYLEAKNGWVVGIVEEHMGEHIQYEPDAAACVEMARTEAISTLDMAEDIFTRISAWLDEWEQKKDADGIDGEWLTTATRLVAQANANIKLIGTLKKEIGVDSQILLAHQQISGVMGVLVDVLRNEPHLLNMVELRLAALKPPDSVQEADWSVVE